MMTWPDVRKAVREAHHLGAVFRIVGDRIEIEGDLPPTLYDALPCSLLKQYLGAHPRR